MAAATISKTLRFHSARLSITRIPTTPASPLFSSSSSSQSTLLSPPEKERGRWSKLLLFLPGAITFGLGTWQIIRRQEKVEMLEYRKERLGMEPIPWNRAAAAVLDQDTGSIEFRKIVCEGVFDEGKSIYIGPRSRSISGVTENGYYVITPLIPTKTAGADEEGGSVQLPILVNRGWVPRGWRNKHSIDLQDISESSDPKGNSIHKDEKSVWWKFWSKEPTLSQVTQPSINPIRVIGVIRGSEKPSIFVPANDPESGQWFYVDVPMIARACGLAENSIYIEDINEETGPINPYPIPKDVNTLIRYSVMPQDHLNYTITWYSLSAAVTLMAFKRIKPTKSKR